MNEIEQLQFSAELTDDQCVEFLGISKRTWRRWKKTVVRKYVYELIKCKCGSMEIFGGNWKGWTIRNNQVYTNGFSAPVTQGDINCIPIMKEIIYTLKVSVERLENEILRKDLEISRLKSEGNVLYQYDKNLEYFDFKHMDAKKFIAQ